MIVFVTAGVPVVVVTVTVADRAKSEFAVADNVIVPLADDDVGVTVSQDWFDVAFHAAFDVTVTDVLAAPRAGDHVEADSANVGGVPACVTVTVFDTAGLPAVVVTVTVAARDATPGLFIMLMVTVPFPVPDAFVRYTHEADGVAVHDVFDVTVIGVVPPVQDPFDHEVGDTDSVGGTAAWLTLTVLVTTGVP